ncbi:hypothetical protein SCHPADRAFT_896166 [Schizopora paradoxa]|uniref:Uncharacterized protein n=1 Tax=Schizopora paradoxa TaxID=27342 RepID=A0A0H2R2H6_9AGAM|nr:hypothetical protein SCHPADRAFT_896166 [Schizopora paradoxa]
MSNPGQDKTILLFVLIGKLAANEEKINGIVDIFQALHNYCLHTLLQEPNSPLPVTETFTLRYNSLLSYHHYINNLLDKAQRWLDEIDERIPPHMVLNLDNETSRFLFGLRPIMETRNTEKENMWIQVQDALTLIRDMDKKGWLWYFNWGHNLILNGQRMIWICWRKSEKHRNHIVSKGRTAKGWIGIPDHSSHTSEDDNN